MCFNFFFFFKDLEHLKPLIIQLVRFFTTSQGENTSFSGTVLFFFNIVGVFLFSVPLEFDAVVRCFWKSLFYSLLVLHPLCWRWYRVLRNVISLCLPCATPFFLSHACVHVPVCAWVCVCVTSGACLFWFLCVCPPSTSLVQMIKRETGHLFPC